MANYPIYRLVKGSTLTFTEMDDNLRWLSANMSASVVTITGSTYVAGNLTVSDGITGSLFGTSSWARNTVSSSYPIAVTGSSIYSFNAGVPSGSSTIGSIFLGLDAAIRSTNILNSVIIGLESGYEDNNVIESNFIGYGAGASNINYSNFIGIAAGSTSPRSNSSNFIGRQAGQLSGDSYNSNFIGNSAGRFATGSYSSIFIGASAGEDAYYTPRSIFIGGDAGYSSEYASSSIFIGESAGRSAKSSSFSTLIGYNAGYNVGTTVARSIGTNNIIIGTNITLESRRKDSINIGALIFGTGSYSTTTGNPFSGSANGRVGINQPLPQFSLDVSGSGRYTNGLTVTGSITGSSALLTGTLTVQTIVAQTITASTEWITGSSKFGSLDSDTHQFTGSVLAPSITGSLFGTASWAVSASWAPGTTLNGTGFVKASGTTITYDNSTYYSASNPNGYTSNTGTVTSVATAGTVSGITLTGGTITTTGTITLGGTLSVLPSNFASQTANTILAAPNGSAGAPTFRTLVAADIPALSYQSQLNGTGFVKISGTTITYDNSTYYSASNPNGYTSNTGTVTSITVSPGTGMSGGGTITSAGTITLTNAAPDQTVVLTNGTGISATGTYPNFTITNTAPDQTVSLSNGTGISVTGTYPNFTISSTGTGANIYNTDGTLTGNRTIDANNNFLKINNVNTLIVDTGAATNNAAIFKGTEPNINISASGASNAASLFLSPSPTFNGTIQNRSGGGLEFYVGSGPALAMTVGSNKNIGIGGVANAINSLEISTANQWSVAAIGNMGAARTPSTNYGIYLGWNYTGGSGEANFVWGSGTGTNSHLTFSSFDGTTKTDRVEFQKTGNVVFKQYTTTTSFTGTVVGFLGFDASGNILTTTGSGATGGASLSGGKTNYNTIWNSTTTVSTGSIFQYSATQVQITGSSLAIGNIAPSSTPGRIDAANDIVSYSTSDIRFKDNIKPIGNALSKVGKISGVYFDWIEDIDHHGNKGHDIGVIAQELEEVLPEVVTTRDSGYKAVKYDKIVALLIQAVKEQQVEINELKSRIDGFTK